LQTSLNNTPLASTKNPPLTLVAQCGGGPVGSKRRYTTAQAIKDMAINKFRKNGHGIAYIDLVAHGVAKHKRQAQDTLKHYLKNGTLFTLRSCRPQEYYPSASRSEVIKTKSLKNTPIDPTGVNHFSSPHNSKNIESMTIQTLEGYVLPLLPSAPLFIHNMHFKLKISPEYYAELNMTGSIGNNGKRHSEIIGKAHVNYTFYHNGTVNIEVQSSNSPLRLGDEIDRTRLHVFLGQLRDRMITFLIDRHERIVPDILEWDVTECDINKDIKVSDAVHFTGIKIQVKHVDHLFRIYVKSMREDTVCRVEESRHPNKPAIELINDLFNPAERIEKILVEYRDKTTEIHRTISHITEAILSCISPERLTHVNDPDLSTNQDNNDTSFKLEES
jgi:hypothetical protein